MRGPNQAFLPPLFPPPNGTQKSGAAHLTNHADSGSPARDLCGRGRHENHASRLGHPILSNRARRPERAAIQQPDLGGSTRCTSGGRLAPLRQLPASQSNSESRSGKRNPTHDLALPASRPQPAESEIRTAGGRKNQIENWRTDYRQVFSHQCCWQRYCLPRTPCWKTPEPRVFLRKRYCL